VPADYCSLVTAGLVAPHAGFVAVQQIGLRLSATTTVYLAALCEFSSGSMTADGVLTARRVRSA
jgi:hypothetical protein